MIDGFREELSENVEEKNDGKLGKFLYWIKRILIVFVVVASLAFGIFYKIKFETICDAYEKLQAEILDMKNDTITVNIIEEKLKEIAELATASFEYSGILTKDNYRELFKTDINIPFTKNEITVEYKGVIKVGYDLDELEYQIDEESKKIYMSLPEARVTDHYMIQDALKFEQKNNVLNPISVEQINKYLVNIEAEELIRAEEEDIYKTAEEKIKMIIENYFAEFAEYEVIFM